MFKKRSKLVNRAVAPVLTVCQHQKVTEQLQASLTYLGYGKVTSVDSHVMALGRINNRGNGYAYDFIVFDAKATDMSSRDFVKVALGLEPNAILIAASAQPHIDDVFGLLSFGARGFLALPFTVETLDHVINRAREGPPFSESVLKAPDRNAALAGVVLNNLYQLSVAMRQAREFSSSRALVDKYRAELVESMELARLFCLRGDLSQLRQTFANLCIDRSIRGASRLKRTRMRLAKRREKKLKDTKQKR